MKHILTALMLAAVSAAPSCSKMDTQPAQSQAEPAPSSYERIVEIDRLLSLPLTGRPDDADRRATLRAERDALTGAARVTARNTAPTIAGNNTQPRRQEIVVAPDARKQDLPRLEQMTPTERKHYYEELRLTHPNTIYPVYYEPRRR